MRGGARNGARWIHIIFCMLRLVMNGKVDSEMHKATAEVFYAPKLGARPSVPGLRIALALIAHSRAGIFISTASYNRDPDPSL